MRKSILILFALMVLSVYGNTQSVKRETIGGLGVSLIKENGTFSQIAGQPYNTNIFYGGDISVRPGFLQPSLSTKDILASSKGLTISVYPNPAKDDLTVLLPENSKDALIQIRDIQGKLLLNDQSNGLRQLKIDCGNWETGYYLLNVYVSKNVSYSSKFFVNK